MPNLLETIGVQYFNEKFHNAYFMANNRVYRVEQAGRTSVGCMDVEVGRQSSLPHNIFTGFKTFEYPILGYRRFSEHVCGYATKRPTSNRGFRIEQINVTWSPCSRVLIDTGVIDFGRLGEKDKAVALFKPVFDTKSRIPDLLAGRLSAVVLSPNVLIEPSTSAAEEWYSVYYKQAKVGVMDNKGAVVYTDPAFAEVVGI